MMSGWAERSAAVIWNVRQTLSEKATYAERKKALHDAYPFGVRAHFPYKVWCREQRKYLGRYKPVTVKTMTPIELLARSNGKTEAV